MDKLDTLIHKLKEAKEELNKNVNQSYSASPNMGGGGENMSQSEKDNGNGKVVEGPKPSPKQADKKMRSNEAAKGETCHVMKNGQWKIDGPC